MKKKITNRRTFKKSFFILVILYIVVLVIGSTYAWVTMSDERINRVEPAQIEIKIEGEREQTIISPGIVDKKNIVVRNVSKTPGFIRISLEETLLNFEIDLTDRIGNGNLKELNQAITPEIDQNNSATWLPGKTFKVKNNRFIKANKVEKNIFKYGDVNRNTLLFRYVKLKFPNIFTDVQESQAYWLYENGYFYYSEIVDPGMKTSVLVENVTSAGQSPNFIKHAFYELVVVAEGYSSNRKSLDILNLSPSDKAYQLLSKQLN